ncbi:MAG: acylneuraminate cytidylyltransferase family protein [Alphaproteobacteria bacterium]|nr:acylneuraminate cytidylyltransferase family protein [Alphaproteobacteria bacterium]
MIEGESVLAVITARGGSKGVPGKNIRMVGGKPLIAWTIEAAKGSKHIDRLVLSSDDDAIISAAQKHGCEVPFKRDKALAADSTPSSDVVVDAMERIPGFQWVVLLQPTSPLRVAGDIDTTIEKCIACKAPAGVTVCLVQENPYWMMSLSGDGLLTPVVQSEVVYARRQDIPPVFVLNGAVYVARTDWFKKARTFLTRETVGCEMPVARSVDIDTEQDLAWLEFLTERNRNEYLSSSTSI